MQYQNAKIKPVVRNVVCTANLGQPLDVKKFVKFGWGIYDSAIYGGKCGYVKSPDMKGRVSVFPSGKMISIGANSIKGSFDQLNEAKFYLTRAKFILDIKLQPKVQNIVATLALENSLDLGMIANKIHGAIYEPEQFPGIILKSIKSLNYLIFSSGKIVITGAKSDDEVSQAAFEIQQKLSDFTLSSTIS